MTSRYRLAIFDFDGTLADSFPFFTRVFNELADEHGFRRVTAEEAPTLRHWDARRIMGHVGLPAWKLPGVARDFTRRMRENVTEVRLFENVGSTLARLRERGLELAIVSSNARDTIETVLGPQHRALIGEFECGMSIFGKPSRLQRVLHRSGVARDAAIYIGDQDTDIEAARKAGIASGAVAWGYGAFAALAACRPDETFAQVEDLLRLGGADAADPVSSPDPA